MNFMSFLLFLVAAFSVSNDALLPLNLDDSNLISTSPSLLDSPPPGSVPLNLPAPDTDPISVDLNLNDIAFDENPTSGYTPKLAQEPSENGAGDGGESSTFPPLTTFAETQIDDSNGICIPESSTGQKREKRQPTKCANPAMLEFYPHVPQVAQARGTKLSDKNEETDGMVRRDNEWWLRLLETLHPSTQEGLTNSELMDEMINLSNNDKDSCIKQPIPRGSYPRPYSFCCLGPSYIMTLPTLGLRLARRQDSVRITNWYNCQPRIIGRPFCMFYLNSVWSSHAVCCRTWSNSGPDLAGVERPDWWWWGFQGVDCKNRFHR